MSNASSRNLLNVELEEFSFSRVCPRFINEGLLIYNAKQRARCIKFMQYLLVATVSYLYHLIHRWCDMFSVFYMVPLALLVIECDYA